MKKFFKWLGIIVGSLVFVIVVFLLTVFITHDRYWFYSSGGELSDLQKQYDAVYYDLNLEVISGDQALKGHTDVLVKSLVEDFSILELDLIDNFDVSKVTSAEEDLSFEHNDDKITIQLKNPVDKNALVDVTVYYEGQPIQAIAPPWIGGFNWSEDKNGDDWIGVSCQGEGGRIWFPCKTHPSDEPDSVALNITVPKPYICASNGILQDVTEPREGFQTFHWKTRYPINNYNINVNIAKYKVVENSYTSVDGNEIPVVFYNVTENQDKAEALVDMAIDMLKTYEGYFGEYPFAKEKFGLAETSYWGMEHQTINAYGNNYKLMTRQGFEFDWLMLHEMGHEWWGNKVTCADWADFWLHEGIDTYAEALYVLKKTNEDGYHEHMAGIKAKIKNNSPILAKRPATSTDSYTSDIYNKGAYMMHSLRYIVGDTILFNTLYEFMNDSNFTYTKNAVSEDFITMIEKNSHRELDDFFHLYLSTLDMLNIKVDSVGNNQWNVSFSNIDFELPVEINIDGELVRQTVSKKAVPIESKNRIIVDPRNWYLHKGDFENK